jgi:hypothetical protein
MAGLLQLRQGYEEIVDLLFFDTFCEVEDLWAGGWILTDSSWTPIASRKFRK